MGGEVKREARGEEFVEDETFSRFQPLIRHQELKDIWKC
jgi:hypothetical protein